MRQSFGVVDEGGLSTTEAHARPARYGPDEFRDRPERSLLLQFLRRCGRTLVAIVMAATARDFAVLAIMVAAYLIIAKGAKHVFYARLARGLNRVRPYPAHG